MPTQKNSASWDLQLGFNLAFKRLTEDLNMKRVSAKFLTRLTRSKKQSLNVCYVLREQVGNNPQILSKVVTRDETWCYGYNPETKQT